MELRFVVKSLYDMLVGTKNGGAGAQSSSFFWVGVVMAEVLALVMYKGEESHYVVGVTFA